MKIGILTFSAAHNFGAILQCYGLYKTIADLGHDVKVVDYCPQYLAAYKPTFGLRQFLSRHIFSLPQRYSVYRYWRRIYDGYMNFKHDHMMMTKPVYSASELMKGEVFDIMVVGSDQVWNEKFNGHDDIWYGSNHESLKWITYAASAGNVSKWLELDNLHNRLSNFYAISARESQLASAINQVLKINDTPIVLDPSLLADEKVWSKWRKPIENCDYILVYQARESDDVFRIAELLKAQLKCEKIIPVDFYDNVKTLGYDTYVASPEEFVSLVANAKCVVTTSFHGTAFSIILETPFYTLKLNDGADGRSENLLDSVGLSDRLIDKDSSPIFKSVDFSNSKHILDKLRMESREYLKNAILKISSSKT